MKGKDDSRTAFFIGLLLIVLTAGCNSKDDSEVPSEQFWSSDNAEGRIARIVFDTVVNDLGRLNEGEQVIAYYSYTNEGDAPLLIKGIRAGCGCTVPDWKKDPLAPGDREHIRVVFNSSGKTGYQDIRITVNSNADPPRVELRLKSIVESNQ